MRMLELSLILVLPNKPYKYFSMSTKIAIKSGNITPFGGIFLVMDSFSRLGLSQLIDARLGLRCTSYGYQYSEIISSLFWIYLCGGDHIEDITTHVGPHVCMHPAFRIPSADTLLRGIKELSQDNLQYVSAQGKEYAFNTCEKLNNLLLDMLLHTKQLSAGMHDLDFDHQFIPTQKYDTVYSYKKDRGYFPGVATIGNKIVGVENRDGNANVRFCQEETLKRIFKRLADRKILINRCRMDCGSFSENIIAVVHGYCRHFYIRASRCQSLYERMDEITDWKSVEINFEKYEVASIPFTSFLSGCGYRLVVQRQERKDGENDLFDGKYAYRCIVTNDHESSELDIILFYNARGAQERIFDKMNNDFGWKHLPCSFLKENTVFLLLTAMLSNFYDYFVKKVAGNVDFIKPSDRVKRFIFRFVSVPAKWVKTGRQWILNLYTDKPYDLIRQT